ncbi:1,4-dihydroxy-2-naphthoate octaprenyltransferase [Confluentibacter sediminis]|uniref:1,4-dihydroxy-2-naphthoate octaprenyltransferase n=1 Tax=Confluentibacter sediminis TaxID=2219045 RepID=UPI001C736026|nr:1,4-dihydroxy-2-naphthoate octaprenyltransferase [Confluentibacter sediminis]
MKNIKLWISAMRLRTLPLSISGIIIASSLAEYNGFFKWNIFILAILTTISFQILSNLANDYGDGVKGTDNSDRIGPERAIQSGEISPESMFSAIKTCILISIVLAFMLIFSAFGVNHFLLTLIFFLLGIASIVAAIRYTVGENAYGYNGLGDVFVFLFFGLVSVIGGYVLYAKQIDHVVFLPACVIGLLSVGVLNLNNMRDMVSDEKSNKITLAVRFGAAKAKVYHLTLIVLAIFLSLLFGLLYYTSIYNLIFIIAYIPLIKHFITVYKNVNTMLLDSELKKLALTTFLLAILMGIGHLLDF